MEFTKGGKSKDRHKKKLVCIHDKILSNQVLGLHETKSFVTRESPL